MKKVFALLLAAAMVFSMAAAAFAEEDPMAAYRTGAPWACIDLEGVVTPDMAADPRDNFTFYANHDFYTTATIADDRIEVGSLSNLQLILQDDLRNIFTDNTIPGKDAKLVRDYYALLLDWDSRNAAGMAPVMEEIQKVEAITTIEELNTYILTSDPLDCMLPCFSSYVTRDPLNPEDYVGYATDSPLMLKDSAEYTERTELGQRYYDADVMLLEKLLPKAGYTPEEVQQKIENIFAWEAMIAPLIYTRDESGRPDFIAKTLNYVTREEMLALEGKMPIVEQCEDVLGFGTWDVWMIPNPRYLEGMQEIYVDENVEKLTDWMICYYLIHSAGDLDRECYDLMNDYTEFLSGAQPQPDEQAAMDIVTGALGWQIARIYCEQNFTQNDKDEMLAIIEEIISHYSTILLNAEFLSEQTRQAAIDKLENIKVFCLYPDDWSKYIPEDLSFAGPEEGGTLEEANRALAKVSLEEMRKSFREPIDHDEWISTPTTINCFYYSTENSVSILAAFCRGDIYNSDMSREEKLAKIGTVVAHEISHAFDSSGAQYDKTGVYTDWWTEEDKAEFGARIARLEEYLNSITLWEGENVHGSIKTGESGADMAAMQCILSIAKDIPDFDYDLFFRSYAEVFRSVGRLFLIQMIQTDSHPQDYMRINTVLQQFEEFNETYGVQEGDNMYLAPENRVLIWK